MALISKIRRLHLSLSTKLILSMTGVVVLSSLASLLIANAVINNQASQLEDSVRKVSAQVQEVRRQNPPPPATLIYDQIKQIVNTESNSEVAIQQVRRALFNNPTVDGSAMLRIVRDTGFPVRELCPPRTNSNSGENVPSNERSVTAVPGSTNATPPPPPNERCSATEVAAFYSYPVGQSIAVGSLISALFAVALGFLLSRTIIRPVRALEQASERIADGNYNHQIKLESRDELGRLARSFNRMAQALRLTEQKRKDLVADVAHELRTPLSSIQGYTEVLRDGLVSTRERQEEILEHILREVKHVTSMVNSMRAWVNSEQALEHLDLEIMPARAVADMVIERFTPIALNKNIELKIEVAEPEPQVQTDADALSHALSNLVDNALRYTPGGGNITIKIDRATSNSGSSQVRYQVEDSGVGIAAEHLPFIFERFYRVDKSRDRNTGGTGLGLAIVRDTVQALGGEVKIESEVGVGTNIWFSLPSPEPIRRKIKRKVPAEV